MRMSDAATQLPARLQISREKKTRFLRSEHFIEINGKEILWWKINQYFIMNRMINSVLAFMESCFAVISRQQQEVGRRIIFVIFY